MESSLVGLPIRAPSRVYPTLGFILALGALSPSPSLPPLILLLAVLRLHVFTALPRSNWTSGLLQGGAISLAITVVHVRSSLHALSSTPSISFIVLIFLSATTTAIAGSALAVGYFVERAKLTAATVTVFPAVWATTWALVEYLSPIGQLATWSPVVQLGGYAWLQSIGGQVAINWVVAAWSVVIADAAGAWMVGSSEESEKDTTPAPDSRLIDDDAHPDPSSVLIANGARTAAQTSSTTTTTVDKTRLILLLVLLALAVPSYFISDLPSHVAALDVTPFGVACALPYPMRNGKYLGPPKLNDYISESRKLQGQANVVLWPESAVNFKSRNEREEAFAKIRETINRGVYYGVGFDEDVDEDSPDGVWKVGMKRNGLVLVGFEGVVYEYYKRHLVPIAESFSMTPSNETPSIFTMQLTHPSNYTAPTWAPAPNHTRPVDLTASICLDFATASAFAGLPSRPALVLAPARTWHTSVGLAMWDQARARAEELGSVVLWCDGGEGGVSGVAGRGMHAFRQVGPRSWAQTVSIPWPYDPTRTVFAAAGTWAAVGAVWAIAGMGFVARRAVNNFGDREGGAGRAWVVRAMTMIQAVREALASFGRRERRGEDQPLLG
ncbi:hypothetical protein V8D89_015593 [Ganoderma adspersum]